MNDLKPHGLIIPATQAPEEYILGGNEAPQEVLQPDGQWGAFLPPDEMQSRNGLETMNCTNYGTLNAIEILMRRRYGVVIDHSERFLGVLSGTTPTGNDPHRVCEAIRKNGAIPEEMLPFGPDIDTWSEYYAPKPMTERFLSEGREWLTRWLFKHEWVWTFGTALAEKQRRLKDALTFSPVNVSVLAWKERNGLYYKTPGEGDNHWCTVYGYEDGVAWLVLDHYDQTKKRLEWNYDFQMAKRYHVERILSAPERGRFLTWLQALKELAESIAKSLLERAPTDPLPQPLQPGPLPPGIPAPESISSMVLRVCKEEGMTHDQTREIYATIDCESNFNPKATNRNTDGTTDWGLCQYNDFWYIGPGKPIPSVDVAMNDPEFCVREMCRAWRKGRKYDWVCARKLFPKVA